MILTHITACSENHVIGTHGGLPWDLPEDMKFFRDTTKNSVMIMGRKTFDSFGGKPLPNRYHIVITRDADSLKYQASEKSPVRAAGSVQEAIDFARGLTAQWGDEVFIIGGGEIYKQTMNIVDKIYLTVIHRQFQGDTYYPEVSAQDFELVNKSDRSDPLPFSFLTFLRKK
jgi:dihydrofolate reductase